MLRKWSATVNGLTKGSTADVHVDFQPTNSWQSVTVSCTVLYVREGVVASRQYL